MAELEDGLELEPTEMASTPTEVELEAGGLRVRCSAPGVALSVVSAQALELWQKADAATPRREVGFSKMDVGSAERRPVADLGGSSADDGRDRA